MDAMQALFIGVFSGCMFGYSMGFFMAMAIYKRSKGGKP
jgi:hypothetical protein